jgi:hypothetical protein
MNAEALLIEFRARGIRVEAGRDGRVRLTPRGRLTPELIEQARRLKPEILTRLQIDQALAIVSRLRSYTLPAGRMPAARAISALLQPIRPELDAGETFASLQAVESELIAMGAEPDPEIAALVELVEGAFPGTQLIEVKKLN